MSASNCLPNWLDSSALTSVSFCHAVAVPLAKGMMPAAFSFLETSSSSSHVYVTLTPAFAKISVL